MPRKLLVVGLDGATWDLVRPWAESGELPLFKKLMAEGAWGPLRSVTPNLTPPRLDHGLHGGEPRQARHLRLFHHGPGRREPAGHLLRGPQGPRPLGNPGPRGTARGGLQRAHHLPRGSDPRLLHHGHGHAGPHGPVGPSRRREGRAPPRVPGLSHRRRPPPYRKGRLRRIPRRALRPHRHPGAPRPPDGGAPRSLGPHLHLRRPRPGHAFLLALHGAASPAPSSRPRPASPMPSGTITGASRRGSNASRPPWDRKRTSASSPTMGSARSTRTSI